jgi:hypothetical protein
MRRSLSVVLGTALLAGTLLAPATALAAASGRAGGERSHPDPGGPARLPAGHHSGGLASGGDPSTTVTFTVNSGALTMSVPASANLGSGSPGTTITGLLGTVTVTDSRALLVATWIATASSTSFTTGGGTPSETIPASGATYAPGVITTTGVIVATGSTIALSGTAQTVVSGTAGVGDNTASWNPTIAVSVPSSAVTGTYTGTLTQSVS